MALKLQRGLAPPPGVAATARTLAVVLALVTAGLILLAAGHDPLALGAQVITNTFGSSFAMEDLALLFTPLIYTGLAVAIALRIGAWNIGAEGQFAMGAFGAAGVGLFMPGPAVIVLPLMILAGTLCGLLWILVPTLARAFAGVSELITTLLLNFVASLLVFWMATDLWLDPSGRALATTARVAHTVPEFWGIVHYGLPIAVALALILALVFARSRWGYEVRVAGANPMAARYAGMPARRHLITVLLASGAIAGLGGAMELSGTVMRLQGELSSNYGYLGIMVAVLARGRPLGVLAAAALMAVILNGGIILQTQGLTTNTVLAITGLILLYAAVAEELAHYRVVRADPASAGAPTAAGRSETVGETATAKASG